MEEQVETILSIAEECTEECELISLLQTKKNITAYDGFEPSGRIHIAQGIMRTINTNKLTKYGIKFKFWIADWYAMLNKKYDGDLDKIHESGKLMIETFKACGMNLDNVEFIWASKEINKTPDKYWRLVMDISTRFNMNRILKCTQIMGRSESDDLHASQLFYPVMQCADIFHLNVDICSLGMDQRKVNMLAREYCDKLKMKSKPVMLSHHMLLGLKGEDKMSKSDPESAIYMDDSEADVNRKIKKAYCPPNQIDKNPIMEYIKYIILQKYKYLTIIRKEEYGGNVDYNSIEDIQTDYLEGTLHPGDLKKSTATYINKILEPVREYFKNNAEARKLRDKVKSYKK